MWDVFNIFAPGLVLPLNFFKNCQIRSNSLKTMLITPAGFLVTTLNIVREVHLKKASRNTIVINTVTS